MTTIKPPATDAIDAAAGSVEEGAAAAGEIADGAEFQALVDAQPLEAAGGVPDAAGAARASEVDAVLSPLLDRVRAGELSVDGAVEALVQRALDGVGANLDVKGRAELGTMLRAALESDPTLIALRNAAGET